MWEHTSVGNNTSGSPGRFRGWICTCTVWIRSRVHSRAELARLGSQPTETPGPAKQPPRRASHLRQGAGNCCPLGPNKITRTTQNKKNPPEALPPWAFLLHSHHHILFQVFKSTVINVSSWKPSTCFSESTCTNELLLIIREAWTDHKQDANGRDDCSKVKKKALNDFFLFPRRQTLSR